ncbi:MAG TPA: winged helix DNA-binding domain-containing protein [Pseudonocardiaceae bacterium]|jgi:hypothetical protein|nr:winged helix DNA-binding domain-containing protein [Pseudonocardiaceae bacterium]
MTQTLGRRALNRATLDRQLLLRRAELSALAAVEHLVGLQAQAPFPPYTGLWTRLAGFRPEELAGLLLDRAVVRVALMRGTVHLVSAADCLNLRPVLQPMLEQSLRQVCGARLAGLDLAEVTATGRELVEREPLRASDLGRLLGRRWPGRDPAALASAVRAALPLVQLPPRAVWSRSGQTVLTTAQSWLGRPLAESAEPDAMVLRYVRAFGPASAADVQKWSGLTRLRAVLDRLRDRLVVFRDENGVELFDLPEAPRPDPETPAPVRFLPEFDNLLLSYVDHERVLAAEHRAAVFSVNGIIAATVLVDGFAVATWRIGKARREAVLTIEPFARLTAKAKRAIEAEGRRLLGFAAADAERCDIRFSTGGG